MRKLGEEKKMPKTKRQEIADRWSKIASGPWLIEEHGDGEALYIDRTYGTPSDPFSARHGLNIIHLTEPAHQWPAVRECIEKAPEDVNDLLWDARMAHARAASLERLLSATLQLLMQREAEHQMELGRRRAIDQAETRNCIRDDVRRLLRNQTTYPDALITAHIGGLLNYYCTDCGIPTEDKGGKCIVCREQTEPIAESFVIVRDQENGNKSG